MLTKPLREQSLLDAFARLFGFAERAPVDPAAAPPQPARRQLRILLAPDNRINQGLIAMLPAPRSRPAFD